MASSKHILTFPYIALHHTHAVEEVTLNIQGWFRPECDAGADNFHVHTGFGPPTNGNGDFLCTG